MKLKLTVLTLLLLGLVFAGNAFAADSAVLSLIATDNTAHTIKDVTAPTLGLPVLRMRLTNTGTAVTNLTSLTFTTASGTNGTGASTGTTATVLTNDGDFTLSLYLDKNKNGVVDVGDQLLNSSAASMLTASATTTVTIDSGTAADIGLAASEVKEFIVIANAAASADVADAVEIRLATGTGNKPFGGMAISSVTSTLTTTLDPTLFANVPSFTVGAGPGAVVLEASVVLSPANVGNNVKDQVVAAFAINKTTPDATYSHVLNSVTIADGGWVATPATDIDKISLYLDLGTVGAFDVNDVLLSTESGAGILKTKAFSLATMPVFIPKATTKNFIITINATGFAGVQGATIATAKENVDVDIAVTGIVADDGVNATGVTYNGPAIGLTPLIITNVETVDNNHDGSLDALKLTFSNSINDTRWASLVMGTDLQVWGSAGAVQATITPFSATAYGDTPNNNVVYVLFTPSSMPVASRYTNGLPLIALDDAVSNAIISADGNRAMLPFNSFGGTVDLGVGSNLAVATVDKAEPVVNGVSIQDANGNGRIDRAIVTFSEPMAAYNDSCYAGVTFITSVTEFGTSGVYTASSGVVSSNTVTYTIGESADTVYDTESVPVFNYNPTTGNLKDNATVRLEVLAYNSAGGLVQPSATIDNARPVMVSVKTGDSWTDEAYAGNSNFEYTNSGRPNGRLDTMVFTFSEAVTTTNLTTLDNAANFDSMLGKFLLYREDGVTALSKFAKTGANTKAPYKPAPTLVTSGTTDTYGVMTVYTKELSHGAAAMVNGGNTGELYKYTYGVASISDANSLIDSNGNAMLAIITATAASDGARPMIVNGMTLYGETVAHADSNANAEYGGWAGNQFSNIRTVDSKLPGKQIGDGYVDGLEAFFSEPVRFTDTSYNFNTSWKVVDALNKVIFNTNLGVDVNGDGAATTADNNLLCTSAKFLGTRNTVGAPNPNTDVAPIATFSRAITCSIYDGSDATYTYGVDNVMDNQRARICYDGAKPVPVYALGSVGVKTITVTWSERVFSNNVASDSTFGASNVLFGYQDKDAAGAASLATTAITYASKVMTITTNANLTSTDVAQDSIWVMTDDLVFDNANSNVNMNAVAFTANKAGYLLAGTGYKITFNDSVAPTIVSATTLDVNGNGKIDYIKVEFSEDVLDSSIKSGIAINTITSNVATQWILSGYTGTVLVNLFENDNTGKNAALAANEPVFTGNAPNDKILYFRLEESKVPLSGAGIGSTGWAPTLTLSGATLTDKKPNVLATTSCAVVDGVGPVIMTARTLTSRMLEVAFSEDIDLTTIQAKDFSWTLGEALENFQNNVAVIMLQPGHPEAILLETIEGFAWESYMGGTIAYVTNPSGGAKVGIADLVSPIANVGVFSNTPAYTAAVWYAVGPVADATKGLVAENVVISIDDFVDNVEESAPAAYALSKNYPNPFNPTTTIEFAIPVAGNVELVIYNINGQKVRTLVNETKDAGFYKTVWDGRNELGESVSSGIYLYRLVSGDFNKIEKMTFIK